MAEDPENKYLKDQVEKARNKAEVYNDTLKALKEEERFINFMDAYHPKSIESFIPYYANMKSIWYDQGETMHNYRLNKESQWWTSSVLMLLEIFSKKLFNWKCRWIAGEIDLTGIETSHDFERFIAFPEECSFVEPITHEELKCYQDYLSELDPLTYKPEGFGSSLTHFHTFRQVGYDAKKSLTGKWFKKYDERFGTEYLSDLPLTRLDIEWHYHKIWSLYSYCPSLSAKDWRSVYDNTLSHIGNVGARIEKYINLRIDIDKAPAPPAVEPLPDPPAAPPPADAVPTLAPAPKQPTANQPVVVPQFISTYQEHHMKTIMQHIETPEVIAWYRATKQRQKQSEFTERIESDIYLLMEAKEYVPIESHRDWRTAIEKAANEYRIKKKLEALPAVFEEYLASVAEGKPFVWGEVEYHERTSFHSPEGDKARLLWARKWKNEAENFDFLRKENLFQFLLA